MTTHALAVIAAGGMSAVAAAATNVASLKPGYEARGAALAESLINNCKEHAGTWSRFYRDLIGLEDFGRKAFRARIAKETKAPKGAKFTKAEETALRSAKVRLSEFNTISKALEAGVAMDPTWAFHYAVGQARTALQSGAATRGRKPAPFLDKLKKFLTDNAKTPEQRKQAAEFATTFAKVN